jgi:hypothetical protein
MAATPLVIAGASVVTALAITNHEIAERERAELDCQLRKIELQGLSNGQHLSTYRCLSEDDVRKCAASGQVIVTGFSVPVSVSR